MWVPVQGHNHACIAPTLQVKHFIPLMCRSGIRRERKIEQSNNILLRNFITYLSFACYRSIVMEFLTLKTGIINFWCANCWLFLFLCSNMPSLHCRSSFAALLDRDFIYQISAMCTHHSLSGTSFPSRDICYNYCNRGRKYNVPSQK